MLIYYALYTFVLLYIPANSKVESEDFDLVNEVQICSFVRFYSILFDWSIHKLNMIILKERHY